VICHAGPRDRCFEEQHASVSIAMVVQGSFQYRSSLGRELMFPGSLLLGNAGQYFECSHEHAVGDRCLAFAYDEHYFESLADEANIHTRTEPFPLLRLPPVRELSSLTSRALAQARHREAQPDPGDDQEREDVFTSAAEAWEEIVLELASRAAELANASKSNGESSLAAEARVTRVVRMIEAGGGSGHNLLSLAQEAKLSRYHFLRVFEHLTGLTPHQYVLRTRLRNAATRLMLRPTPILEIALDCGFGDVSNFNHAFRAEFGVKPSNYRKLRRSA
jgi:AraC-like DNA-binding protein